MGTPNTLGGTGKWGTRAFVVASTPAGRSTFMAITVLVVQRVQNRNQRKDRTTKQSSRGKKGDNEIKKVTKDYPLD